MHIYPNSIGAHNADDTITEPEVCALTGVSLRGQHQIKQMLGDGVHFVRVMSQQYAHLTDDVKAELLASVAPKPGSKKASLDKSADDGATKE